MKLPWMQFHTGDWLKDPHLSMCLPATRGIWIDAIAAMHENSRSGTLTGTPSQLSAVLRCTKAAFMAALSDLQATGAAEIEVRNGVVTMTNRRMAREAKEREANRLRQERARAREPDNGSVTVNVTPMSLLGSGIGSSSLSVSLSSKKEEEALREELFQSFWRTYPRKENPKGARAAFEKAGITAVLLPDLIRWIALAARSEQWQDKSKIPHPATWLNQRRWEGDPPPMAGKFQAIEEMKHGNEAPGSTSDKRTSRGEKLYVPKQ